MRANDCDQHGLDLASKDLPHVCHVMWIKKCTSSRDSADSGECALHKRFIFGAVRWSMLL